MSANIHISETPLLTARALADFIMVRVKEKTKQSLPFYLAVSGGSTPQFLFEVLAAEYAHSIPWHFVRIFWVDERCVPPTHPESNFGMTYEYLLSKIEIPAENIFRMQGENDPTTEAIRYQNLLFAELPSVDGLPEFDLILLGIGDDGHTASIFPNSMELLTSQYSVAVSAHPVSAQKRITLTGQIIGAAKQIAFLSTGSNKASILGTIIMHQPEATLLPAAHIQSKAGGLHFFLDKAAASVLK